MDKKVYIRDLKITDLLKYKEMIQPEKEYHKFNGPYYDRMSSSEIDDFIETIKTKISRGEKPILYKEAIVDKETEELIGEVNWYWKSKETNWLEVGIIIFNEKYWGKGIGYIALPMWINKIFKRFPEIVRIGLSTWSGNLRMIKLAEKIGLKKEAEYKKARIVDGTYYDSLSYGILKDEWIKKYEK